MEYRFIPILFLLIFCCSSDEQIVENLNYNTIVNLHAPANGGQGQSTDGNFTKFDFESGMQTMSESEWDIAFRTTTIIVNGGSKFLDEEPERTGNAGAYIYNGAINGVSLAYDELIQQDSELGYAIPSGSGNGWYNYSGEPNHIISPIPGKTIVFRTRDNRYAKIEIISYYLDAPNNPNAMDNESRYYTFNYFFQSEFGNTSLD